MSIGLNSHFVTVNRCVTMGKTRSTFALKEVIFEIWLLLNKQHKRYPRIFHYCHKTQISSPQVKGFCYLAENDANTIIPLCAIMTSSWNVIMDGIRSEKYSLNTGIYYHPCFQIHTNSNNSNQRFI